MNLDELKKLGGFTSHKLDKVSVEWKHVVNGKQRIDKFDVFIKKLSFGGFDRMSNPSNKSANALLISETVMLGENGEQPISYEDADRLEPSLALAINEAIDKYLIKLAS